MFIPNSFYQLDKSIVYTQFVSKIGGLDDKSLDQKLWLSGQNSKLSDQIPIINNI